MSSQHDNSPQPFVQRRWPGVLLFWTLWVVSPAAFADDDNANSTKTSQYFAEAVLPLLKEHCYECHSHDEDAAEGGLVLDSRAGWRSGGDSGTAIAPGRPAESLLLTAVNYSDTELQMPPDGKLRQRDIDVLKKWIVEGAFDPRVRKQMPPEDSRQLGDAVVIAAGRACGGS